MKRKYLIVVMAMALSAIVIAGCGGAKSSSEETPAEVVEEEATEAADEAEAEESVESVEEAAAEESADEESSEETVGMANPWVSITEDEAKELCARLFKAPDDSKDQEWSKCEELGDPDNGVGPLVQLSFTLDDLNFTARAQMGAAENADIAGNFVEWTVGPEDATLANWGGGNMPAKVYRSINDTGYVDMITWYDIEIGIAYSLSVADKDLDGFDIQAVAEQMYSADNEDFADIPGDFLQEQSGKTTFESYDDAIAQLTTGQGYAYIKLVGSDEEVLAVTDTVFEADNSAYEISVYAMQDGEVKNVGNASGNGSSYPLRLEDGIIYGGDNHTYETYFLSEEYGSLMLKDYIDDGVNTGSNEISGFTREKNSFEDETPDYTGTAEDFEKLLADREEKPIIEFTAVE